MNRLLIASFALIGILCAGTTLTFAATDETPLEVSGHVSPGACDVSLGDDGTANYGQIDVSTLSNAAANNLGTKQIGIEIQCSTPTKIGLRILDNRALSADASDGINTALGINPLSVYGLGTDDFGANLGAYRITLPKAGFLVDGVAIGNLLASDDEGSSWTPWSTQVPFSNVLQRIVSWGAPGINTPITTTDLTGTLLIQAAIKSTSIIAASRGINLDGNATLEVVYL